MWFVRTKDGAYFYERAEGNPLFKDDKPPRETHEPLNAQAYDNFFALASRWQQGARCQTGKYSRGRHPRL
jgi:hypothetical protein